MKKVLFLLPLLFISCVCFPDQKNTGAKFTNVKQGVIEELLASMVTITGGTFKMGQDTKLRNGWGNNERPIHRVYLNDFKLCKYEVTQEQWWTVMGGDQNDDYCRACPKEGISWNDVEFFLFKLNSLTGRRFRLPTEAEWEYAARGGNRSHSYIFSGSNNLNDVANNAIANGIFRSIPVGSKKPNELGLYDMSGNVWEWCSDWYSDKYYSVSTLNNPKGPVNGEQRVLRGGSWSSSEIHHRVKTRSSANPNDRGIRYGFRIAEG